MKKSSKNNEKTITLSEIMQKIEITKLNSLSKVLMTIVLWNQQ